MSDDTEFDAVEEEEAEVDDSIFDGKKFSAAAKEAAMAEMEL